MERISGMTRKALNNVLRACILSVICSIPDSVHAAEPVFGVYGSFIGNGSAHSLASEGMAWGFGGMVGGAVRMPLNHGFYIQGNAGFGFTGSKFDGMADERINGRQYNRLPIDIDALAGWEFPVRDFHLGVYAGTGFNADAVRYFSRPEVSDIARNIRRCDVLAQGGITFRQQNAMCGIWLKCGLLPQYSLSSTKMNNYSGGVSFTWFFREP